MTSQGDFAGHLFGTASSAKHFWLRQMTNVDSGNMLHVGCKCSVYVQFIVMLLQSLVSSKLENVQNTLESHCLLHVSYCPSCKT